MVLRAGLPKCLSHELGTLAPDLQIDVQGAPRSNATSQRALERRCILLHGPIPSWAVPPVIQSVRTVGGARKAADFLRRCTARMQDSVMNEVHAQTQARHAHALNRGTSFARAQLPYRQQHALCKALRPQVQQSRVALKFVVLRCINATGDTLKGQRLHVSRQIFATDLSSGEAWRMRGVATLRLCRMLGRPWSSDSLKVITTASHAEPRSATCAGVRGRHTAKPQAWGQTACSASPLSLQSTIAWRGKAESMGARSPRSVAAARLSWSGMAPPLAWPHARIRKTAHLPRH